MNKWFIQPPSKVKMINSAILPYSTIFSFREYLVFNYKYEK